MKFALLRQNHFVVTAIWKVRKTGGIMLLSTHKLLVPYSRLPVIQFNTPQGGIEKNPGLLSRLPGLGKAFPVVCS